MQKQQWTKNEWQLTKVRNKKEVIDEARKEGKTDNGSLTSQEFGVRTVISEVQRSSRTLEVTL